MHQTSSRLDRTSRWRKAGPYAWSKGVFSRDDLNLSTREEAVTLEEPKNFVNVRSYSNLERVTIVLVDESIEC